MSERTKDAFSRLVPGEIDFYRIPSCGYYVASAREWSEPQNGNPGFRFIGGRCKGCGRQKEVYWSKSPPTLREAMRFLCVNMESRIGARETWIVSQELADELKKATPLSGVVFSPKEFDDGRPAQ